MDEESTPPWSAGAARETLPSGQGALRSSQALDPPGQRCHLWVSQHEILSNQVGAENSNQCIPVYGANGTSIDGIRGNKDYDVGLSQIQWNAGIPQKKGPSNNGKPDFSSWNHGICFCSLNIFQANPTFKLTALLEAFVGVAWVFFQCLLQECRNTMEHRYSLGKDRRKNIKMAQSFSIQTNIFAHDSFQWISIISFFVCRENLETWRPSHRIHRQIYWLQVLVVHHLLCNHLQFFSILEKLRALEFKNCKKRPNSSLEKWCFSSFFYRLTFLFFKPWLYMDLPCFTPIHSHKIIKKWPDLWLFSRPLCWLQAEYWWSCGWLHMTPGPRPIEVSTASPLRQYVEMGSQLLPNIEILPSDLWIAVLIFWGQSVEPNFRHTQLQAHVFQEQSCEATSPPFSTLLRCIF